MLVKTAGKFIFLAFTLFLLIFSFAFVLFQVVTYDGLVHGILQHADRMDLYQIISTNYFTAEKYNTLKTVAYLVSAFSFIGFIVSIRFRNNIIEYFQHCCGGVFTHFRQFTQGLVNNSTQINFLLFATLALVLLRSIWYALAFYIQHDEAWNYNFFLQKNIIYSLFVYNNYPLHNIVSWFLVHLLPLSTFLLRVPSVLAGLLACMLVFVSVKTIFKNEWIALSAMCLFACLPLPVFYMLYARGVMFEICLALLVHHLLCQYLGGKVSVNKILLLALLNGLGVMSMLSHVYFIVFTSLATTVYLFLQQKKQFQFIVLYPLLSLACSTLFLSPMLAGTGLSPGLNAGTSAGSLTTLQYLPFHSYSDFTTGTRFGFYLLFIANIFFLFLSKAGSHKLPALINLVLLLCPFIIMGLTAVSPPERAMAFLVLVPLSTFAIFASTFKIRMVFLLSFTIIAVFVLGYVVHHHQKLNWSKKLDEEVYKAFLELNKQNISSIHDYSKDFFYFIPGIQFYYAVQRKEIQYTSDNKSSTRYKRERDPNTQCIAIDSAVQDKKLIFRFGGIFIYDTR